MHLEYKTSGLEAKSWTNYDLAHWAWRGIHFVLEGKDGGHNRGSRSVKGIKEAVYQVTSSIGPSLHSQLLDLSGAKSSVGKTRGIKKWFFLESRHSTV